MNTVYHQPVGEPRPRRGDLIESNIGDRRERTWLVLGTHTLPTTWCEQMGIIAQRTRVWAARWWQLEPEMRVALWQSAERAGGQRSYLFERFKAKRKRTFEDYIGRR